MSDSTDAIEQFVQQDYKYGFVSDIEEDTFAPGLSEEVIRALSARKEEPEWLLEWRLKAYRHWKTLREPHWAKVDYPPIRMFAQCVANKVCAYKSGSTGNKYRLH